VDVKEDSVLPLHVMNASDQVHSLAAETVIAFAKPVTGVVCWAVRRKEMTVF